jgi:hypothetical protein
MKRLILALVAAAVLGAPASADDDKASREVAAKRYVTATDTSRMIGETVNQMALTLPAEQRSEFVRAMNGVLDVGRLEAFMIALMADAFTTEELSAIAGFYESPVGQSVLTKMPKVMATVQPFMQQEVMRALQQLQQKRAPASSGKL